jgi:hypothetical protein
MGEYSIDQEAGALAIQWMGASLPGEILVLSIFFLALMPFLFFFRRGVATFAHRHLHIHWSPQVFGLIAPALSIVCASLLLFVKEKTPVVRWDLGTESISVRSLERTVSLLWTDVATAIDSSPEAGAGTALFLKTSKGEELWLPLSWLTPEHRGMVVDFINDATQNRFGLSFSPPETEDDEDE